MGRIPLIRWQIDWEARVLHSLIEYCARVPDTNGALKVWRATAEVLRWYQQKKALNQGDVPWNGILPVSFINGLRRKSTASQSV
jgi:hypothetical protein